MYDCLIAFGSNLGHSLDCFKTAAKMLADLDGVRSVICSEAIVTRPVGGPPDQNDYINGCIRCQALLSAPRLFERLVEIENSLGRQRRERWGSRKIDLDLLLFDLTTSDAELVIPHPRMTFRRFVLQPANQIASDMIHPPSGQTISQLLGHLDTRPNRIGFVVDQMCELNFSIENLCQSKGWEWGYARDCETLASQQEIAKLLVYSRDYCSDNVLMERAERFPGPTLDLSRLGQSAAISELEAAIDAMGPI